MRKKVRDSLEKWAIAYHKNPAILARYPSQVLAVEIHDLMKDGEWRTSKAIALELKRSIHDVRDVMWVMSKHWDYEVVPIKDKGYRRKV